MHKGVILLARAETREEAEAAAKVFLEDYGDGRVWDWYQIGGRWSGLLDGYDPDVDPRHLEVCSLCGGTGDRKDLEPPEWKAECGGCNGCGGKGKRPVWPPERKPHEGDILPLVECLSKVKEWASNISERVTETLEYAERMRQEQKSDMHG